MISTSFLHIHISLPLLHPSSLDIPPTLSHSAQITVPSWQFASHVQSTGVIIGLGRIVCYPHHADVDLAIQEMYHCLLHCHRHNIQICHGYCTPSTLDTLHWRYFLLYVPHGFLLLPITWFLLCSPLTSSGQ